MSFACQGRPHIDEFQAGKFKNTPHNAMYSAAYRKIFDTLINTNSEYVVKSISHKTG